MLRTVAAWIFANLLLLCGGLPAAAKEPARLALLIGNESYSQDAGPLKNPRNDIALIRAALVKVGFAQADITVISNASRVDMLKAFDDFAEKTGNAGPDAIGFFYYSGHGAANERHENYLIPVDVSDLSSGFWYGSVSLQELLGRLSGQASQAKHFVVFDACRNTLRLKAPGTKALVQPKGYLPLQTVPGGMLVAFSTAEGELASDQGASTGPYAQALAEEIVKPGLEAITVFRNAQLRVSKSNGQKPWTNHGPMDAVYFAGQEAPAPQARPTGAAVEWAALENSANVVELEAYRKQFEASDPYWSMKAARRIEALKKAAEQSGGPQGWWPYGTGGTKPAGTQTAAVTPPPKPKCDGLLVSVAMGDKPCIKPGSGAFFKDCPNCPEMVIVPSGSFNMGSPESEPDRESWKSGSESPQHRVKIAKPFAVGRYPVTFAEWDACVDDGGCGGSSYIPRDQGWGRGDRPVIDVSWDGAKLYIQWLSRKTRKEYRLLSEAEREYVTRAGTDTPFWWGSSITPGQANYDGSAEPYKGGGQKGDYRQKTLPVKSFKPNPWGLYQVHGNVWDWVEDCWHENYNGAPSDGSAWTTGECKCHVLRGGSWDLNPQALRAAFRNSGISPGSRGLILGFRVAADWQDLNR
jgi:formylglycine-generating enzyme required for sulfatase activity